MYDHLHLQLHRDRVARAERAHRHHGPRPPRPPGRARRVLAAALRTVADALAPADVPADRAEPGW